MTRSFGVTLIVGGVAIIASLVLIRGIRPAEAAPVAPDLPLAELLKVIPVDLRYQPKPIPEAQNGWIALAKAARETPSAVDTKTAEALSASFATDTHPAPESPAGRFRQAMDRLERALALKESAVVDAEGDLSPSKVLRQLRMHGTYFGTRAISRMDRGHAAASLRDIDTALRLSKRICESGPQLEYAVMASSLLARTCRDIRSLANHPKVDEATLRRLIALMPTDEELDRQYAIALRSDLYWFIKEEIQRLKGPGMSGQVGEEAARRDAQSGWNTADEIAESLLRGHPKPFDRVQTVEDAQAIYAEVLANLGRPWSGQVNAAAHVVDLIRVWPTTRLMGGNGESEIEKREVADKREGLLKADNPYGRLALWYFLPISEQSGIAPFRNRADVGATRIVLALRAYELQHGSLPTALDGLWKQGYVSKVPLDPFSGKPFRYDPQLRKLWSVGPDGRDDNGNGSGVLTAQSKDFVWFLPQT